MPSKSEKQHRLMEAVKHNPKFAKKVGIPQSVGEDFVAADKRTGRYATGGGVLGTLAGRSVRPIPDASTPRIPGMLLHADRVITGARNRLGPLMKKAKGGKVAGVVEALKKLRLYISDEMPGKTVEEKTHYTIAGGHTAARTGQMDPEPTPEDMERAKRFKVTPVKSEDGEHHVDVEASASDMDDYKKALKQIE